MLQHETITVYTNIAMQAADSRKNAIRKTNPYF